MHLVGGAFGRGGHTESEFAQTPHNHICKNDSAMPEWSMLCQPEVPVSRSPPSPISVEHYQREDVNHDASLFLFWRGTGAFVLHD
jgi:hypothetical protein